MWAAPGRSTPDCSEICALYGTYLTASSCQPTIPTATYYHTYNTNHGVKNVDLEKIHLFCHLFMETVQYMYTNLIESLLPTTETAGGLFSHWVYHHPTSEPFNPKWNLNISSQHKVMMARLCLDDDIMEMPNTNANVTSLDRLLFWALNHVKKEISIQISRYYFFCFDHIRAHEMRDNYGFQTMKKIKSLEGFPSSGIHFIDSTNSNNSLPYNYKPVYHNDKDDDRKSSQTSFFVAGHVEETWDILRRLDGSV